MKGLCILLLAVLNFGSVDRAFERESYKACRDSLCVMLSQASGPHEKAEVLWRLSRVTLMLGEKESAKEVRRTVFAEGIRYADEAIAAEPANIQSYMWHCANTGRECQTHGIKEQAAAVPVMLRDLETILDRYGRTNFSEAWQALAEIFHEHPLKSNDKALNYARKAVATIPARELRLTTYLYLAELLYERNASASKRAAAIASDAAKYAVSGQSNTERMGYFVGSTGTGGRAPWSEHPLASISDREEAVALVRYAMARYENASRRTKMDVRDYRTLSSLAEKWK